MTDCWMWLDYDTIPTYVPDVSYKNVRPGMTVHFCRGYAHVLAVKSGDCCVGWVTDDSAGLPAELLLAARGRLHA